jgi:hypothetical protein
MNSTILRFLAVGLLVGPVAAHAVWVDHSTAELVTARDCIAGDSGCDSLVRVPAALTYGGLPGDATSTATVSLAGYGAAAGIVSLSGTIGAPILRASATSDSGKRLNTNSIALQSYTYTGNEPTTRTFGGTLTYSQHFMGGYPLGVSGGIFAAIDVFKIPSATIDVGDTAESNFYALLDAVGTLPGYVDLGNDWYSDGTSTAVGLGTLGVEVTLEPGDMVWVWALVQTPAANGEIVDASHTFVTSWDSPADLTPAVSVPEPDTLALVGAALLGVMATHRRKPTIPT